MARDQKEPVYLALWPAVEDGVPLPALLLVFAFLVCLGLILNVFVIYRMSRLLRRNRDQFFNGTGVYLMAMAICDIASLLLSYLQLSIMLMSDSMSPNGLTFLCKMSEFLARCSYSFSMYCWLFMSALRYLAACQPLRYSTVWRSPWTALSAVAAVTLVLNLHTLVSITGNFNHGCVLHMDALSTLYSVADVILSAGFSSLFILALDIQVLCCRSNRKNSDPLLQTVFHKLEEDAANKRITMRWFMMITLVALMLCLPEGVLRCFRLLLSDENKPFFQPLFYLVKTFFLTKFSFNSFYLSSFVFDRNVLSKASSSRHLSVSARRLEEEPAIVPRERSRTLSCRGPSPLPQLTRNSSCILLDTITLKHYSPPWV
ncbi:unnamed protein product [Caenorhabditis auriculariae]|uniref:G-protein coupled receptors family 1 profile domain-containing protein n=1 Tax=Caenorhabditis auriculariae TaxID=2777116 RepID=A0A8S1HF41_9PELO|nr:unnamed protein product [Caenorhabditis auriculariae]